ncbi:putative RNA-binding protein EIF1AD [Amphibalanus amphitrite]|uniref:Probable RNA-binding protein EIF1AD n=1 Tax=Amphibalanus amphitrite TaxID=1232801 RepID=A0A6A4V7W0_AMPAM|nr:probable RNA-binding protein EIF1AD [Amphibalanus amphitrite]XP_043224296.1 probable RNA-binding protein EIF1AD [Amphibalanus amphitrite]XP_043224297.1 probable RNA-binding protein EIF1AD [Amphibalanus amphitrite]KAF0287634.1 putative RNA-binding protein EIF1AD [Amphibalanus amphitrite]
MSSKTKRKYVYQEHMSEVAPPSGDQTIARLLETRGNNLHQVEDANGEVYLVSMPNKFRRNIWVRRGTFLILEPIAEGDKVRAEVVRVLSREHVTELRSAGAWPERFDEVGSTAADEAADELQNLDLEEGNPNRPPVEVETDSESESEESEEDSESDGDADRSGSESGV